MNTELDLYQEQERLEKEMLEIGRHEFARRIRVAKERGLEGETRYGKEIMSRVYQPVYDALLSILGAPEARNYTKRTRWVLNLAKLNLKLDLITYLTCRYVIDRLTVVTSMHTVAMGLADLLIAEAKANKYVELYPDEKDYVRKRVDIRASYAGRRKVMSHIMSKVEMDWQGFAPKERLEIGAQLLHVFVGMTGLAEIKATKGRFGRGAQQLHASKGAMHWIEQFLARTELMAPAKWPMIVKPMPWAGMWTGGYLTLDPVRTPIPFIKLHTGALMRELEKTPMPEVWRAVNIIQDTPFTINTRVLEVLKVFWESGWDMAGLPQKEDRVLPPKPDDIADNEESRRNWSKQARKVHDYNVSTRSKRIQVTKTIWLADKFKEYENLYFPYQADFRGRLYCVPQFLNPQGPDYARALLLFSRGKPLGSEDGPGWLAVHMANCFGVDKVSFDDRIKWVEDNQDKILASAANPFECRWWCDADDPWLFLAACFEWQGYIEQGPGYVCRLPVTMDGSCNGLQHFSAMLRDAVGGSAVNLVPKDMPADIYSEVAKVATRKIQKKHDDPIAAKWLKVGVTRKVTKRPVMVVPYGGTRNSTMKYIDDALVEHIAKTGIKLFHQDGVPRTWEASAWLTPLIWDAIGEVVIAARSAMKWLSETAKIVAKAGYSVEWTTPDGFRVIQSYKKQTGVRLDTTMALPGKHTCIQVRQDTDEIHVKKQGDGISPNFVHSLDATHMRWYVLTAIENDINNFMVIHDSYGALPSDVTMMGMCLREAFVDMYEQHDVLTELRDGIFKMLPDRLHEQITPVPPKGELDIQLVKKSEYFFA